MGHLRRSGVKSQPFISVGYKATERNTIILTVRGQFILPGFNSAFVVVSLISTLRLAVQNKDIKHRIAPELRLQSEQNTGVFTARLHI